MQILFFVLSILLGVFVGIKFFQHRILKGHRKVTSGFWAFAAGFIVMCGATTLLNLVLWGQGNQPESTLPPFDPNHALPTSLLGDASTDEDLPDMQADTHGGEDVAKSKHVELHQVDKRGQSAAK